MGRVYLDDQAEANLQEPVIKALEAYFDQAYTPDSEFASLGTMTSSGTDQIIVYNAFRVDEKHKGKVLNFMSFMGEQLAAISSMNDPIAYAKNRRLK